MTLGAAPVVRPLHITDGALLHGPFVAMLVALAAVVALAARRQSLARIDGLALLAGYVGFVAATVVLIK